MAFIFLFATIILALVFGLAGATKILDLKSSCTAMIEFGVPRLLSTPLGFSLPFLELLIACSLLDPRTVRWGALAAIVLLSVFALAIVINLSHGKRPDCHCFGQLHSEPVGPSTLLRNGFLLLLAALVFLQDPNRGITISAFALLFPGRAVTSILLLTIVLATVIQSWVTFHLFRQNGRLLLRIEALETSQGGLSKTTSRPDPALKIGVQAPTFELSLARGGSESLHGLLRRGKPVVLVFSDPHCGPCKALMPDLARWEHRYSSKLTFAVITRAVSKDKIARQYDLEYVFIQKDRETAQQYQAVGTPTAILVGADGLVASAPAFGASAIGNMISAAVDGNLTTLRSPTPSQRSNTLLSGSQAPSPSLLDLSGKRVRLDTFLGRQTMVLFWNPNCNFCNRMLPALKHWEHARSPSATCLVVISTGGLDQNRAMGLHSPVLLDDAQNALQAFGANGTPSALIIDKNGKIASELAFGAEAIFSLVGGNLREI
jgi:thiol-disulfide isomerase/thioredoxin